MVTKKTEATESKAGKAPNESDFDLHKVPARVERVVVSGLLRTHDDYITRVANNLFKTKTIQEIMLEAKNARQYLQELGIFNKIDVQVDISHGKDASPDGYEVSFEGSELSRFIASFGTEIGQNEGSLRTEFSMPNIFGRGEKLAFNASISSTSACNLALKFWKSFSHTRFGENRPALTISLLRNVDRKDLSSFQNSHLSLNTELSFKTSLPFNVTHSLQYEASIRELSLLARTVPFFVREQCGPKLASLVRYAAVCDRRDNSVFPNYGVLLKSINEYCGLGGNVAYRSHTVHAEVNVPLLKGFVGQICGRIGTIHETKRTTTLPLSNLYYCGGPLTLRGFTYGGAGPVVDGAPIGAQTYWSTGLHLWGPCPLRRVFKGLSDNLRSHFFYNCGNFNTFSIENMRSSFGVGMAFRLAERARIEFNYCVPLKMCAGDRVVNGFQFGVGYEFV